MISLIGYIVINPGGLFIPLIGLPLESKCADDLSLRVVDVKSATNTLEEAQAVLKAELEKQSVSEIYLEPVMATIIPTCLSRLSRKN